MTTPDERADDSQATSRDNSYEARLAWLRAAIAEGDAQIDRDEVVPFSKELMDEIEREVEERFLRGERSSPDVCPPYPEEPW